MELVLDFGNARGKWYVPRLNAQGDFRHAIARLTETEWRQSCRLGKPPKGYIRVNGMAYAVGDAARRHTIADRPKGAARYTETYYGIGLAFAASEALQTSDQNMTLRATYPPGDVDYASRLVASAKHEWEVESHHGNFKFNVKRVGVIDEPLGGLAHYMLNADGTEKRRNPLANATILVIDVGGYTVDTVAVDPGGEIDTSSLKSTRTGIIQLTEQFESEMRANNLTLFQDMGDLDIRRVEDGILTGTYRFGKVVIDCQTEARAAVQALVYDVTQIITGAGGIGNYDAILVTGGGGALIFDALQEALPRIELFMAEQDRTLMKYANVFGASKMFKALRRLGG
ncbi:MAG TPA: ParM/StbA family protein [Phototrophicaceae bacterium]|nr:ParM/StbA family protein [Phototrophicaceae bacterium]